MAAEERRASERETPLVAVEQCAAELAGSDEVAEVAREQRSVWWLLVASLLFAAANSWTFGALFDVYLYVLSGGSNSFVGTAETVKGLIGLGTAVPLGYLADKRPRAQVLRVSSLCGLLVAAGSALGMLLENQGLVLLSVGCFAALSQSCSGAVNALLADLSTPGEARAQVMARQAMMIQVGNAGGPFVQLILFWCFGDKDTWSAQVLMTTLLAGLLCIVLLVPVAFAVGNAHSAGACSAEISPAGAPSPSSPSRVSIAGTEALPAWARRWICGDRCQVRWIVVVLVETSFILTLLITGMSVKYFPLFFKQDLGFQPTGLCMLNVCFPLFVAGAVPLCMRLARRLGTVQGIVLWTILGGALQVLFARASTTWLAVTLYFLRQAVMKSRDPLYQALLMDCLESRHRGRFGSLLSLRSATWAGSALLGGVLLDHNNSNYRLLFQLSGLLIILLPTVVISPLLFAVPRRGDASVVP